MALPALQEQPSVQGLRWPRHVEKSGATIGRPEFPRPHKLIQTHPLLADIVEQITDWDIPDDEVARATMPKGLPSTTPYLIMQYRVPTRSDRHFGPTGYQLRQFKHVVSTVGTGVVTLRPNGPLGLVIVRLKPEAAASLVGCSLQEFINEKINLCDVFNADRCVVAGRNADGSAGQLHAACAHRKFLAAKSASIPVGHRRVQRPRNVCGAIPPYASQDLPRNWMLASGTCRAAFGRCSGPVRSSLHASLVSRRLWRCGKRALPGRISHMPAASPTRRT